MKKKEKKTRLKDFSDYINDGIIEVGKDQNLDVEVINIVKGKQGKMPQSMMVLQSFALDLAERSNYSTITFRVLCYFIALSQYENFVSIDIKTISENLNISEPSVKRSTKQLVDDNIIIKVSHPSDKRRVDYFINPKAAWKGKTINRDKWISKAKKNKLQLDLFTDK